MAHMLLPPPTKISNEMYNFDTILRFRRRPNNWNYTFNCNYNDVLTRIRLRRSSSSSSCCCCVVETRQAAAAAEEEEEEEEQSSSKELRCCENGWSVRKLNPVDEEMRKVAYVQAQAFHVPVALFDHLLFQFFQAEVLAALLYRLRNSPPDRYACLVAEPESSLDSSPDIIGVVDVTVQREDSVVQHCQGAHEYLYVSGIAVLNNFRRQKVATALLKACEMISIIWGFEYLALRAYEDDYGARQLYTNAGYKLVSGDPPWMTTWIGRKRRILMIKRSSITTFLENSQ